MTADDKGREKLRSKAAKALPFATAIFPGADLVIRAVPVASDFAVLIKVPTAVLCLAIAGLAKTPKSKRSALRWAMAGVGLLVVYLILAGQMLHSDAQRYSPGDNAIIGLWPTPNAVAEAARRNVTMAVLRNETGPVEWETLYSRPAQAVSALLLAVFYCAGFALLTLAFKKLPTQASGAASPEKSTGTSAAEPIGQ